MIKIKFAPIYSLSQSKSSKVSNDIWGDIYTSRIINRLLYLCAASPRATKPIPPASRMSIVIVLKRLVG